MTDFDFTREMVYGKKHLNIVNFELEKYDISSEVEDLFGYPLDRAHLHQEEKSISLTIKQGDDNNCLIESNLREILNSYRRSGRTLSLVVKIAPVRKPEGKTKHHESDPSVLSEACTQAYFPCFVA